MITKQEVVRKILQGKNQTPRKEQGAAFAPTNIALCKYWGKRNNELNLPTNTSLSVTLPNFGTLTKIQHHSDLNDGIWLNNNKLEPDSTFVKRLKAYLDLFRISSESYHIEIETTVPIAAGLASSACGFAALVKALEDFYGWGLERRDLSILSRLGSGSACRSLWDGFVEWQEGSDEAGMDSHGVPMLTKWPDLCLAILMANAKEKAYSSRQAMQHTIETSPLYTAWPKVATEDLQEMKEAIHQFDFEKLGTVAESNALMMHAIMMTARPAIVYSEAQTLAWMHQIWEYRKMGKKIFFTQDAGPNLKLFFLKEDLPFIQTTFPGCAIIFPFQEKR